MKKLIWSVVVVLVVLAAVKLWLKNGSVMEEQNILDEHVALDNGANYRVSAASSALAGPWQSTQDPQFRREFKPDGTAIDSYDGEPGANQSGTWTVFTRPNDSAVYLKMTFDDNDLAFEVTKVTPEALQLINLGRGNILIFEKRPTN